MENTSSHKSKIRLENTRVKSVLFIPLQNKHLYVTESVRIHKLYFLLAFLLFCRYLLIRYANQLEINMHYDRLIADINTHISLAICHYSVIPMQLLLRTLKYFQYFVCNVKHIFRNYQILFKYYSEIIRYYSDIIRTSFFNVMVINK